MNRVLINRRLAGAVVLALLAAPGCFSSGELSGIRRDLQAQLPGSSFEKNIELSLGPIVLGMAKMVTAVVPGAHEARSWLTGVSRVQIGVYDAAIDSMPGLRMPARLQSLLDDGWETAVRVRDADEAVWLLYRPDGDSVREIFVVVLDRNELVLVKAKGRLDRLIAAALDEAHGHRSFADELNL
ncbi:MAG TPA: DUF4252 domain-containing protein [Candidatus Krumholzibacteria bacterium]